MKKHILITGGAGFIGSNISDAYVAAGHQVTVIDNLSTGKKSNLNKKVKFVHADISDARKVKALFQRGKFDVVSHHAAQIDVRKSISDPGNDARINILGTINILENARTYGVKKVIFASSGGTIYGECPKTPPDESFTGRPISPYGITKFTVEFYLKFYALIYGMKYTILRYANVYGPRQDPHGEAGVVAIFSDRMLMDSELLIFGDGEQDRDYVFVGDVVQANVLALDRGDNEIINVGMRIPRSVNELYRSMAAITGYKRKPIYKPARAGEILRSVLNNKKARTVLGWKPQYDFDRGLAKTIDYFREKLGK